MKNYSSMVFLTVLLSIAFLTWRQCLNPAIRHWANWRFASVIPLAITGYLAPNLWVYYGAVFAVVALLPRSRSEAAWLFLVVSFMLPLAFMPWFVGTTRLIDTSTVSVGAVALLTALRFPADPARASSRWSGIDTIFLAMFALTLFIAIRIIDTNITVAMRALLSAFVTFAVPYFAISRLVSGPDASRRMLHCIALIGFMLAVVALFENLRHWPLYVRIDSNLGTYIGKSRTLNLRGGLLRAPGPFLESTAFGAVLASAVTMIAASRRLFRSSEVHFFVIAVGCAGTFATLARNSWLGLAIGLIMIGLYKGFYARTAILGVLGATLLTIAYVAAPNNSSTASLFGKSGAAASTADYRSDLVRYSIPVILSHPLAGLRGDQFGPMLREDLRSGKLDIDVVNSYVYFGLCAGLTGLAIFATYSFAPIVNTLRIRSRALRSRYDLDAAAAVFGAGSAFAVSITSVSYSERLPLFAFVLLAVARQFSVSLARNPSVARTAVAGTAARSLVIDPSRPVLAGRLGALAKSGQPQTPAQLRPSASVMRVPLRPVHAGDQTRAGPRMWTSSTIVGRREPRTDPT